jgi:magnesium-transporting ATPase (P-type)
MLTGDKMETAENIGRTCSLINDNMLIRRVPQDTMENCLENFTSIIQTFEQEQGKDRALII